MRKHLVKSAEYWFNAAQDPKKTKIEAIIALANAYNHVENALKHILDKFPEAKAEYDRINVESAKK